MSRLEDFLGLTDVSEIRNTISVKLGDKEFEFVIKPLSESEHNEFQKRCNVYNKNKVSFDNAKYNRLILESCIVEPDFNNADFLKKVGCISGVEFLEKKFPAGVLMDIGVEIQKLSGFNTYEVEIENAKN